MIVRISARAALELRSQIEWLEQLSPQAANAATMALREAIHQLAEHPHSAPRVSRRQRQLTVKFGRDGFIVRYHLVDGTLMISRVLHGRQSR